MGKITELLINAVRMRVLTLLTGTFRDWSFRCMYGMRHRKKVAGEETGPALVM